MKKIKSAVLVLSVFALLTASCKKGTTTSPQSTTSISLKFNGVVKSSNSVVATYYKSVQTIQLAGVFGTEAVSLEIENAKVGTFDVGDNSTLLTYSTKSDFADTYIADTGSVTITSLTSTTIAGTFQFSGSSSTGSTGAITEGKFQAKLITQ